MHRMDSTNRVIVCCICNTDIILSILWQLEKHVLSIITGPTEGEDKLHKTFFCKRSPSYS